MAKEIALDIINSQEWLEPAGEKIQEAVHDAFESAGEAGQKVKNALHGVWLGHPLHPAVTDIPVGAWTAAVVCDALEDITGNRSFGKAADYGVAIGLAGAVAAAASGLADWSETQGKPRNVGLAHGLLNLTGAALYTASLICRNQNKRSAGRGLGVLGYAATFASAWLGGELVYKDRVGVNHAPAEEELASDWTSVSVPADFPEGELKTVDVKGTPALLVRRGERIYALAATCSHAGGPLPEGTLEGDSVVCPWHKSQFDLQTGAVINGPATFPQPCFEVRVRNGGLELRKGR